MARILITGSTDGLGLMAAELLAKDGHAVTLHARNQRRAADAREQLPAAKHVVIGDLASIEEMHQVAGQANSFGRYDAVIHNAGVQAWLAVSGDPAATVTGGYFYHKQPRDFHPAARSIEVQEGLLDRCAAITG